MDASTRLERDNAASRAAVYEVVAAIKKMYAEDEPVACAALQAVVHGADTFRIQKEWGYIHRWVAFELVIDFATINAGGYSSQHYHPASINTLGVVSGELILVHANNGENPTYRFLERLQPTKDQPIPAETFPPGYRHRFFAPVYTKMIEFYTRPAGYSLPSGGHAVGYDVQTTAADIIDITRDDRNGVVASFSDPTVLTDALFIEPQP